MLHRIITALLLSAAGSLASMAQYAAHSALSKGRWAKVETPSEGIYQITYDQLRNMGFSNPSAVQVYGIGATGLTAARNTIAPYADDMTPTATLHSGNKILFYGTGTRTIRSQAAVSDQSNIAVTANNYDSHCYYFLSDSEGTADIPAAPVASPTGNPLKSHISLYWLEDELFCPTAGGCGWLGKKYAPGETASFTIPVRNFQFSDPDITRASFLYWFGIRTWQDAQFAITPPAGLTAAFNKTPLPQNITDKTHDSYTYAVGYQTFAEAMPDGDYTFRVEMPANSYDFCAADRIIFRYPRLNKVDAGDPSLVMNIPLGHNQAGHQLVFPDAAGSDLHVWNIDRLAKISELSTRTSGSDRIVTLGESTARLVAFDASLDFPSPSYQGSPRCADLHGAPVPELLIIATPDVMNEAEQLADLHRKYQGMDVLVVDHNDLYDEFSHGSRNPMAYRRLAKLFYDRDPERFKYLLFMGATHYDSRCISLNYDPENLLVPYEQDSYALWNNSVLAFTSDAFFSMLDDSYDHSEMHLAKSDIAVGRVPALNSSQARNYVDKVKARFENPMPAETYSHVMLTAGAGDNGTHAVHQQEVDRRMRQANPYLRFEHEYYNLFADTDQRNGISRRIAENLAEGTGYFSFSGHGNDVSIGVWTTALALSTRYDRLPIVMVASCDQFAFDRMSNGLLETMLTAPGGGAIGGVAAGRNVYINYNQLTCAYVGEAYAQATGGTTGGQIFQNSRNNAIDYYKNGGTVSSPIAAFRNVLGFNYGGDPAIPVGAPYAKCEAAKVNDAAADDVPTMAPLTPIAITGTIKANGRTDSSFNGTAQLQLFEGEKTVSTANVNNENEFVSVEVVSAPLLATASGNVSNGCFSFTLNVPTPSYQADFNRIVIYATADDGRTATGSLDKFKIDIDAEPEFPEEFLVAPEIISLSAGETTFDSAIAPGACTVTASVDPSPSGIVYRGGELGSASRAILDISTAIDQLNQYATTSGNGPTTFSIPLEGISEGSHTIELVIVNNAGKSDRRSLTFEAVRTEPTMALSVDSHVSRGLAVLSLAGAPAANLVITDPHGNTVASVPAASFPYTWNLTDRTGAAVPSGHYKATALINHNGYVAHATCDIVVVHQ